MKIKFKKIEIVPDKYGHHIKINMVGLYDDNGKWIKWAKLNDNLLDILKDAEITFDLPVTNTNR